MNYVNLNNKKHHEVKAALRCLSYPKSQNLWQGIFFKLSLQNMLS